MLKYYDITSLYPYINKTARYPVGHPQILMEDDLGPNAKLKDCFGIAKVRVQPPRKLLHPVLPMRSGEKLLFPLCKTCAHSKQQSECRHSDMQRSWTGTYFTPEILAAKARGYTFPRIFEIYHFSQCSKYDERTKEGGLFTQYVNLFLKYKQESSGWPDWCKNSADKEQYIQEYKDREGIILDESRISHNPGLRTVSKNSLNSFWGRYVITDSYCTWSQKFVFTIRTPWTCLNYFSNRA